MEIGETYELEIEKLIYGGEGIGRINQQAVFVAYAAPGDRVRVRITKLERNFARGVIEEILEPSAARRAAPCQHFGVCGGCQLQHLNYKTQLEAKAEFIRSSLQRIGGIQWEEKIEILSADEFGYRSRAEIKIQRTEDGIAQLGFFQANSHEVCNVTECLVLLPEANRALERLHTKPKLVPKKATRIFLAVSDDETVMVPATGENSKAAEIDAQGTIHQSIAGFEFAFGSRSFFQGNRLLIEQLVATATDDARGEIAFDLYAGAGLFSLPIAKHFEQVYAVEGSKLSGQHGINNAKANRVKNVEYALKSVEAWLKYDAPKLPRPDWVLLDPPRAGAGEIVVNRLMELKPARITYISCDPATLARDLKIFTKTNYKIDSIVGLDMFPQTYHVETVVKLSLLENAEARTQ